MSKITDVLKNTLSEKKHLHDVLYDENWCNTKLQCYYGGTIQGQSTPKDVASNFVLSVASTINQPENKNIPISTKLRTDSFFIIMVDHRATLRDLNNEIEVYYFFYDGSETIKNLSKKKMKVELKQFDYRNMKNKQYPFNKINQDLLLEQNKELKNMFYDFSKNILKNKEEENEHTDNCECGCQQHPE